MMETPIANMPQTFQMVSIVLWGVGVLAMAIYSIYIYRKQKTLYAIFTLLGSLISIPYEAINNVLGHCLHPQIGQITAVTALGRPIPVWTMLAYAGYFAIPVILLIELMIKKNKFTPKRWWIAFVIAMCGAYAVELIFVKLGVWFYYGDNQPIKLLGTVPLWWGFVNGSSILSVTVIIYSLHKYLLNKKNEWIILPIFPMIVICAHGAPSFFAWWAVSSSMNTVVTNLGAIGSMILSILAVWIGIKILEKMSKVSKA